VEEKILRLIGDVHMKELRMRKAFICYYDAIIQIYKGRKASTRLEKLQ
jgi:hypothetical protein